MTVSQQISNYFGVADSGTPVVISQSRESLPKLFQSLGYQRGAEIGVWEGHYSERICRIMPGVDLTCVDPWKPYSQYREKKNDPIRLDEAYRTSVERLKPYGCNVWRMTSIDAAKRVPDGSLDFVYIDANHGRAFAEEDIRAWTQKIRSGGILSGHDYVSSDRKPWIEVKEAVDAYTSEQKIAPFFILTADKSPSWFWVVS